jgi:hypothetical protein
MNDHGLKKYLLAGVVLCAEASVHAAVIDFEGYAPGTIIDNEYAPAVTLHTINLGGGPDAGVVFDTGNPTGGDSDLGAPFSNTSGLPSNYMPGNVLIIQENHTCDTLTCTNPDDEGSRRAGTFYFDFSSSITLNSIDFFDIESAENGTTENNAIKLFDAADNLISTFHTPYTGGDNTWDQLVFDVSGVKRIELNMGGSGAIDNIAYTVIPVPAAAWLFASGLVALSGIARRKTRSMTRL